MSRSQRAPLVGMTCVYAALMMAHAQALRAAGVTGKAPPNAATITQFVSTLTDNALWIIGTVSTLSVVVVGGLFFFGHSRAQDYALRIGAGALILVSASGLGA